MRQFLPTRSTVLVGLGIASIAALTATDASAKRIRLGGSRPAVSVVPIPGSASTATAASAATAAASATVAGSNAQEAEQAAAIQRAQAKLAAERGSSASTTTLVSEQVNTSAGGNTLVCIAGCYK